MRPRVIAVFGPSHRSADAEHRARPVRRDVLAAAHWFGACIAAEGHILLTGGDGSSVDLERQSVKDAAIEGARERDGAWVGVLKEGKYSGSHRQHVIATGLGDRRNFLEALMCHAAIAFHGGPGTHSEVACAFALQRPIALIGSEWRECFYLDGDNGPDQARALLKRAVAYLKADRDDRPFTSPIGKFLVPERGPGLRDAARNAAVRPFGYSDLPLDDATLVQVVRWAADA